MVVPSATVESRSQAPWWITQSRPIAVCPRRETPGWTIVSSPIRTPGSIDVRSGSRMVTPAFISATRWRPISRRWTRASSVRSLTPSASSGSGSGIRRTGWPSAAAWVTASVR